MSNQLKQKGKLGQQLYKISSKMMEKALSNLSSKEVKTRGEGVHNARKRLKQLRGMLRLSRYGMPRKKFKKQERALRNAARPLSKVRDADVMRETLDQLKEHYRHQVNSRSFRKFAGALLNRRKSIRKEILVRKNTASRVFRDLRRAADRLKVIKSMPNDYEFLESGVTDVYSKGRVQMKAALDKGSSESFHAWRKSVKYLRYQLEVLEAMWPPVIGEMAAQARHLADILGFEHDLVVLMELADSEYTDRFTPEEKELLHALVNQRRLELQHEASTIGPRLFAETPKQFSRRLKGYRKSWKTDSTAPAAAA